MNATPVNQIPEPVTEEFSMHATREDAQRAADELPKILQAKVVEE